MPDIPEEAVQAAAEALSALSDHPPLYWEVEARAALEAAIPILEKHLRQTLADWFMGVGQDMLQDPRNAPGAGSGVGYGWAGAMIGASILVAGGYPKERGDDSQEAGRG